MLQISLIERLLGSHKAVDWFRSDFSSVRQSHIAFDVPLYQHDR